jgi:hypothetical protein
VAVHRWTEKADLTWEQIFPVRLSKGPHSSAQSAFRATGPEEFTGMLKAGDDVVEQDGWTSALFLTL